jgi:prepilin-type N-terminal cleavage/methylation domain-containing protein
MEHMRQKKSFRPTRFLPLGGRRAFTLVELLVVIAIIGLLSSVAAVSMNSARDKSRYAKTMADVAQIAKAVEVYNTISGAGYPADQAAGTMPPELASYLGRWPSPPCAGWSYDYENWSSGNTIEIHVQKPGVNVFYYCIYGTPANPCGTGSELSGYGSKSITCNE